MLTFSPTPSLITTSHKNPFPHFFNISTKTHKFNLSFGTKLQTGFCLFSLKSGKNGEKSALEQGSFEEIDDEEDIFDDDEDDEYNDEDVDEEGEFVPLKNMKKWLVEKPSGFGDGKKYDTSVEDKLLDEMQQSREAQLINLNKLKNSSQVTNATNRVGLQAACNKLLNEMQHRREAQLISLNKLKNSSQMTNANTRVVLQASEVVPSGIRVRLSNLPKKKNIDRDLKRAFKGIPGIINIIPAVSGNLKTRDPICKGFAFVDLKSGDYAQRFATVVSGQSISFGKMEKQIKCEVMTSKPQNPAVEQSVGTDFGASDSSSYSISANYSEGTNKNTGPIKLVVSPETGSKINKVGDKKLGTTDGSVSKSSKPQPKVVAKEKKQEGKKPRPKVTKLNVPGSANRLKVREKAMLTGVLSKYAATSLILQEQR